MAGEVYTPAPERKRLPLIEIAAFFLAVSILPDLLTLLLWLIFGGY